MSCLNKKLNPKELENFISVLSSFNNPLNVSDSESLNSYEIDYLKQFLIELSNIKDSTIYKNILCKYLFNRGYNSKGNSGWLEITTIKQIIDIYDPSKLKDFKIDGKNVFSKNELSYLKFISKLFSYDAEVLFSFVDKMLNKKIKRNTVVIGSFFEKLKKYKREIINSSLVTLSELDALSSSAEFVTLKEIDGVKVYTVYDNDFKVLYSYNDDKIHCSYSDASKILKNSYCYEFIPNNINFRFTTFDDKTILKINKDEIINKNSLIPKFIIVSGMVTDEIINVAKREKLSVVSLEEKL